jgi:hypothetical protein
MSRETFGLENGACEEFADARACVAGKYASWLDAWTCVLAD